MEESNKNIQNNKAWWQPALALFFQMSVWVGIPVLVAVFIGKWFDGRFGTSPFVFLSLVGFSFVFSMSIIIKIANKEYKKIELEEKNKKK